MKRSWGILIKPPTPTDLEWPGEEPLQRAKGSSHIVDSMARADCGDLGRWVVLDTPVQVAVINEHPILDEVGMEEEMPARPHPDFPPAAARSFHGFDDISSCVWAYYFRWLGVWYAAVEAPSAKRLVAGRRRRG